MGDSVYSGLKDYIEQNYREEAENILPYLPTCPVNFAAIQAVMINEVAADTPEDDFYSTAQSPYYMQTTLPLFHRAGADVQGIQDILDRGIYITNAVKLPKSSTTIETGQIQHFVPLLEKELSLFPSLKVIMLMGDVAKKAFNAIAKGKTKKSAIPAGSTYKLRHNTYLYEGVRLLPAYIMTGQNLAIEKSKTQMSAEEIAKMLELINT